MENRRLQAMLRFSPNPNSAHLIDWSAWEEAAFRKARAEDKPVMLFLGAFWCRFCQRMDEGALSDRENMALLNAYFSSLRLENATRPDIDARYNLNGWPTIAFFTPGGELMAASNYLPAEEFKNLLLNVYLAYQAKSPQERQRRPEQEGKEDSNRNTIHPADGLNQIAQAMMAEVDRAHGGFGSGQKFIHPAANGFLLALYEATGRTEYLVEACRTLDGMAAGPIHDSAEGGFFRTTSGADWTQPHREKLLHEHAGLLANYLHALRLSGRSEYRAMAEEIIAYLDGKLLDPGRGAFFGCEDFLRRDERPGTDDFFTIIDDCVYSDANALAARAYLEAARGLARLDCAERALGVLEFLWRECRTAATGVFHYHDGAPRNPGLLEDQVQLGEALLEGYAFTGQSIHLDRARQCADFIAGRLRNPQGGYFDCVEGEIALRSSPLTDLDQNGAAASFFLRLAQASGNRQYREAAEWAIRSFAGDLSGYGVHGARFGRALLEYLNP